jgi:lipopolysaccharide export system protein LptA
MEPRGIFCLPGMAGKPSLRQAGVTPTRGKTRIQAGKMRSFKDKVKSMTRRNSGKNLEQVINESAIPALP